ncbi:hypothetical protein [Sphingomonas sp. 3-13AW]|uniref:hypothetical protein n=1 Tax=Sphingomonas sp. 3-13AW TaxID=3050450 RepID=UPI003BB50E02
MKQLDGEWWHGSTEPLTEVKPFLHVGTIEQASMRGGRGCHLVRVGVAAGKVARRRDTGSWRLQDLQHLRSRGTGIIVYLNRYEGIPIEEFEAARAACRDIDALSDARFRKLLPSARDSLIILDEALATILA